jgi:hypothetical protein
MCFIDEENCLANLCQHGACTDGVDTFECECEAGWDGENCNNSKYLLKYSVMKLSLCCDMYMLKMCE